MATKLTHAVVEKAVCPAGKKDRLLFDSTVRGFGVRISASGGKSFIAQYRAAGVRRRVALGDFGTLTVEQGRQRARAVLGQAAEGRDPFAEAKAKDTATRAAQDAAKRKEVADAFTFEKLVEGWVDARSADLRAIYLVEARRSLRHNLPDWLSRPASSITTDEAIEALDDLKAEKGTYTANRTKAYASAAFSWAVVRRRLATNPLKGVERPGKEKGRETVLSADDIAAI